MLSILPPPEGHAQRLRRVVVWIVLTAAVGLAAVMPSQAAAGGVVGRFRLAFTTPPRIGALGRGDDYVVLQAWEGGEARRLEAAHPGLVVLVYQDFGSIAESVGPDDLSSSGVAYRAARTAHRRWFLTRPGGAPIRESGYPYLVMADVGNHGYERRWAADVVDLLRHGPWDGVFMDDVNASAGPEAGDATIVGYPSDGAYQRAVGSMLGYVGPRIRATGKLAVANFGEWLRYPTVVRSWLRDVDGGMNEKFVKVLSATGQGYLDSRQWLGEEHEAQSTVALHKRFFAVTDAAPGDTQAQLYGWASLLLAGGGGSAYLAADSYTGAESSLPAYGADIGHPTGSMAALANGAYLRAFSHGLVVVNPSTRVVRVAFGRRMSGSGLSAASSATLTPHTGLVLVRASLDAPGPHRPWLLVVGCALLTGLAVLWRRLHRGSRAGRSRPRGRRRGVAQRR